MFYSFAHTYIYSTTRPPKSHIFWSQRSIFSFWIKFTIFTVNIIHVVTLSSANRIYCRTTSWEFPFHIYASSYAIRFCLRFSVVVVHFHILQLQNVLMLTNRTFDGMTISIIARLLCCFKTTNCVNPHFIDIGMMCAWIYILLIVLWIQ